MILQVRKPIKQLIGGYWGWGKKGTWYWVVGTWYQNYAFCKLVLSNIE